MSHARRPLIAGTIAAVIAAPLVAIALPTAANAAPCGFGDDAMTAVGASVDLHPLWNDSCTGDPADTAWTNLTFGGAPSLTTPDGTWTVTLNTDVFESVVTFAPAPGFTGVASTSYTSTVENGGTSGALLRVLVQNPAAEPDEATIYAGGTATISPLTNDAGLTGTAEWPVDSMDGGPSGFDTHLAGTTDSTTPVVVPGVGTWTQRFGNVTFTPEPAFVGDATIDYTFLTNGRYKVQGGSTITVHVVAASVSVDPTPITVSAAKATGFTVTCATYVPGEPLTVTASATVDGQSLTESYPATADDAGGCTFDAKLDATFPNVAATVTITVTGDESGRTASADLQVTADPVVTTPTEPTGPGSTASQPAPKLALADTGLDADALGLIGGLSTLLLVSGGALAVIRRRAS